MMMRVGAKIKKEDLQHLRRLSVRPHIEMYPEGIAEFQAAIDHYQPGTPRTFGGPSCDTCGKTELDIDEKLSECKRCKSDCWTGGGSRSKVRLRVCLPFIRQFLTLCAIIGLSAGSSQYTQEGDSGPQQVPQGTGSEEDKGERGQRGQTGCGKEGPRAQGIKFVRLFGGGQLGRKSWDAWHCCRLSFLHTWAVRHLLLCVSMNGMDDPNEQLRSICFKCWQSHWTY